jgi:predicted nucleic acid-binding protein
MPSSPPRFYWDACVVLAYISGEAGRLPDIESLLDQAEKGDIEIFTSELSVVEVAFAAQEKSDGTLDPATEAAIDDFWNHPSPVKRMDIHALITKEARRIIRTAMSTPGRSVQAADAIHLATAKQLGVDEIHTYEELAARKRWAELTGLSVEEPVATQPMLTPQNAATEPQPPA